MPKEFFYTCLEEVLEFVDEEQRSLLAWTDVREDDPIHEFTPEERGSLEIAWRPRDIS